MKKEIQKKKMKSIKKRFKNYIKNLKKKKSGKNIIWKTCVGFFSYLKIKMKNKWTRIDYASIHDGKDRRFKHFQSLTHKKIPEVKLWNSCYFEDLFVFFYARAHTQLIPVQYDSMNHKYNCVKLCRS